MDGNGPEHQLFRIIKSTNNNNNSSSSSGRNPNATEYKGNGKKVIQNQNRKKDDGELFISFLLCYPLLLFCRAF